MDGSQLLMKLPQAAQQRAFEQLASARFDNVKNPPGYITGMIRRASSAT